MGRISNHILHREFYQNETREYRDYLRLLGYAESTFNARYLYLKGFFWWLEERQVYELQDITAIEVENYYKYLQHRKNLKTDGGLKKRTVHDIMNSLQTYLTYALHLDKIKTHPASHLTFSKVNEESERRIFTQQEISELYGATETLQERTVLDTAYGCGLRVHEISLLNRGDIRLQEKLIIVQKGKNSKRRLVPINDMLREQLQEFIASTEHSGAAALLLNNRGIRMRPATINKLLKKIISRTAFGKTLTQQELNHTGIHSLRHSIATHLLANGMRLQQVQQFLGHRYIESTEIYTHISQNQINALLS